MRALYLDPSVLFEGTGTFIFSIEFSGSPRGEIRPRKIWDFGISMDKKGNQSLQILIMPLPQPQKSLPENSVWIQHCLFFKVVLKYNWIFPDTFRKYYVRKLMKSTDAVNQKLSNQKLFIYLFCIFWSFRKQLHKKKSVMKKRSL